MNGMLFAIPNGMQRMSRHSKFLAWYKFREVADPKDTAVKMLFAISTYSDEFTLS
jgi:hypothetical protein